LTLQAEFNSKVVVITGGTSGVGEATVKLFVQKGAKVIFSGTNEKKADNVLKKIEEINSGGMAVFYKVDNRDIEQIKALATFVKENYGNCEILFNNASILDTGLVHEEDAINKWDNIINTNLRGTFLHCHFFIPQMLENKKGIIVNCSSISGLFGDYGIAIYNASKGGISNLTRAMALDYFRKGIRVNAICPGAIYTEMFKKSTRNDPLKLKKKKELFMKAYPIPHICTPEECAKVVLFLSSGQASWINGVNLPIDGGITAHSGHPKREDFSL
jgi:meso-butanediol dehydrogenase/(S,S)-butanediol dehydrogenase/diacetyl reductase